MTLKEAKDIVAKKNGFESWDNIRPHYEGRYFDDVAELYAQSKWDEACEAQRKICYQVYMNQPVPTGNNKFEVIRNEMIAIENAPKPEFKP